MRIKTAVSAVLFLLLALVSSAPAYAGTPGTASAPPTPQIALSPESAAEAVNGRGAVIFGNYEQDNNIGNGKEPIEWLVLEVWGDRALLISKYGLDARPYNTEHGEVTWENCSLRKWLNGEFLNDAFTPEEQAAIVQMPVDNSEGQGYGGWSAAGGNNTEDRVFLLSCAEANKYLGVTFDNSDNMGSRMSPTAYALQAGALSSGMKTTDGAPTCAWWLRSSGYDQISAAVVYIDGSLYYNHADYVSGCVRPALWVDLGSDFFIGARTSAAAQTPAVTPMSAATPTPAATPTSAATKKPVRVGGKVRFGHYPQTAGGKDDTPIEWLVLEVDTENRRVLVISRYALDRKPYNSGKKNVTWETCTLRKWLNGTFLDMAFTEQERKEIETTKVDNSASQGYSGWSTDGGNDTEDRIFLLSYAEAWRYFDNDSDRQCRPTEYAAAQGVYVAGNGNCWWWLRSPGSSQSSARAVHDRGARDMSNVEGDNIAVRPVLWLNLDSGIF